MRGLVYKSTGNFYQVKTLEGILYNCRIKGVFRNKGIKSTNPIAVGDWVEFDLDHSTDELVGIINKIEDRKNYIVRKSVNLSKQLHIIASNIDLAFLIVTLQKPVTTTSFMDRFLITAQAYGIEAILLFNKEDTLDESQSQAVGNLMSLYQSIGYNCFKISAKFRSGLEVVKELMHQKTCMISGHSGVGKSTLINAIEPTLDIKTKQISQHHNQGQHTTTFAQMYDLTSIKGKIIDTPGIRGFGLVDIDESELSSFFPEFLSLKKECKFNNCLHIEEPKCAVKKALEAGQLSVSRYESYRKMLEDENENYRSDSYK